MALAPVLPLILRGALLAKAGWVAYRTYQNRGDVGATFVQLCKDAQDALDFLNRSILKRARTTAQKLQDLGPKYSDAASLLLSTIETLTGYETKSLRSVVEKARVALNAYQKLGEAFPEAKAVIDQEMDVESELEAILRQRYYQEGLAALSAPAKDGETVSDRLASLYQGLYYIGRTGHQLKGNELDSVCNLMQQMHTFQRPKRDIRIIVWYQTSGVSNWDDLPELLLKVHEIKKAGLDVRYVAYALGQPDKTLTFDGLVEELGTLH